MAVADGLDADRARGVGDPVAAAAPPAGVPHSWQNLAPGVRIAWQELQVASPVTAPHSGQKRPPAGAPQAGQGVRGRPDLSGAPFVLAMRERRRVERYGQTV